MSRTALIAGGTGLVGSQLLDRLLAAPDYARVVALGRRAPQPAVGLADERRFEFLATDFTGLDARLPDLKVDDAFCCLGTTRAAAGSRAAFAHVDFDMVIAFARFARDRGAQRFVVVSALGASARSPAFYLRVKGCMESAVASLGFASSSVVRPSLLLGQRAQSRLGEALAQRVTPLFAPLLVGPLRAARPVRATAVANAMLTLARSGVPGHHVYTLPLATVASQV
ncbi:MAG TPA: NAD-dependent epimerase/dehydratase family protein [Nevskiaceae bacterium]|nr:NAD-dependent epimerase/dehydratase family protein [Nevskiaceae bacterium]